MKNAVYNGVIYQLELTKQGCLLGVFLYGVEITDLLHEQALEDFALLALEVL